MSGALAQLRILLGLDATDVEAGAKKAKGAFGDFSTGTKAAIGIAGVAVAAGFGLMARGAMQGQRAMGDFQAQTGATAAEARDFVRGMDSIAGSAGTVGRSFEEITRVGTSVAQQFGITGQKATDLTENILEFAKVTRQDADGAARQLDDTLTAFGMSADDAAGFMDKLVVSQQKYGTDVGPETLGILQQMAPAVQTLGANADDAMGFLNAMETAGVDAGSAVRGLTAAVKNTPAGTEFNDIITKLGAIEDPADRAKEAIRIFGAKAGVGLAQVIQPGMTSLDDFKVTIGEAEGATQTAAEGMMTDSDKIRGVFDKLLAGARELGTDMGPALAGIGGLTAAFAPVAPKIAGLLKDMIPKLVGSGTLVGTAVGEAQALAQQIAATGTAAISGLAGRIAAMAIPLAPAGTTVGTAVGGAMTAGMVLAIPLAIAALGTALAVLWVDAMKRAKEQITNDPNSITPQTMFGARAPGWAQAKVEVAQQMQDLGADALAAFNKSWNDQVTALQASGGVITLGNVQGILDQARAAGEAAGGVAGTSAATAASQVLTTSGIDFAGFVDTARPGATAAGVDTGTALGQAAGDASVQAWADAEGYARMAAWFKAHANDEFIARGKEAGEGLSLAMADAMNDAKSTGALFDSIDQLKTTIENFLSPRQQAIKLIGGDYIKTLGQGMTSEDENIRTTAQDLAIGAIATIEAAGLTGKKGQKGLKDIGILYDQLMASGMTAQQAATELVAAGVASDIIEALTGVKQINAASTGGTNTATAYTDAVAAQIRRSTSQGSIDGALHYLGSYFHGQSPPPRGPLHTIDIGGRNVGRAFIEGLTSGIVDDTLLGRALQSARDRLAAASANMSPIMASVAASFAPPMGALAGAGGMGGSYTVNAYGSTPDDVERQLRRLDRRRVIAWETDR